MMIVMMMLTTTTTKSIADRHPINGHVSAESNTLSSRCVAAVVRKDSAA